MVNRDSLEQTVYVAIRRARDTGREWINLSSLSQLPEEARAKSASDDATVPQWAAVNPVVRIVRAVITTGETV